ncbi:MAG: DUF4386 family protein [Lewinella sp.]|nr:DUF4386 family protein [Lewinella sp.]
MKYSAHTHQLQRIGGWSALIEAGAYLFGFVVLALFLTPDNAADLTATEKLAFVLDKRLLHQVWMLIIYVVFGVALVPLVTALHERLRQHDDLRLRFGTLFGYIWVVLVIASGMIANLGLDTVARIYPGDPRQATTVWIALEGVQNGLGGGVEIVGGLWVLLLSWVGLRTGELSRFINYLGLLVGLVGILTAIPGLSGLGAAFGLLQISWFALIGLRLLRQPAPKQA